MTDKQATIYPRPGMYGRSRGMVIMGVLPDVRVSDFRAVEPFIGALQHDFTGSVQACCYPPGTLAQDKQGDWYEVRIIPGKGRRAVKIDPPSEYVNSLAGD